MPEFDIIEKYFRSIFKSTADVAIGIGDDAAVINVPAHQQLVACVDTIVEGQHFFSHTAAHAIAHRALAVNLSDMAAMGATPRWFTLALTLPHANDHWLSEFSQGLFQCAEKYGVSLVGGDTTQGPLTVTIQVLGTVEIDKALPRNQAQVGDGVYVTGCLGDAGLALAMLKNQINIEQSFKKYLCERFEYPTPQLQVGQSLKNIASSAIDISDGLAADIQHILSQSGVGAEIQTAQLPLSPAMCASVPRAQAIELALTAGDDYELCFTVPLEKEAMVRTLMEKTGVNCTLIGYITEDKILKVINDDESILHLTKGGWECL